MPLSLRIERHSFWYEALVTTEPAIKKLITPPPARSRGRRPVVKVEAKPAPEPVLSAEEIPGRSGVKPVPETFEHADLRWEPADAEGESGSPIGYALALESRKE
jgi:hypothetical protein